MAVCSAPGLSPNALEHDQQKIPLKAPFQGETLNHTENSHYQREKNKTNYTTTTKNVMIQTQTQAH